MENMENKDFANFERMEQGIPYSRFVNRHYGRLEVHTMDFSGDILKRVGNRLFLRTPIIRNNTFYGEFSAMVEIRKCD